MTTGAVRIFYADCLSAIRNVDAAFVLLPAGFALIHQHGSEHCAFRASPAPLDFLAGGITRPRTSSHRCRRLPPASIRLLMSDPIYS